MTFNTLSIRAFVGANDFAESRAFYRDFGFEEIVIGATLSCFSYGENVGFYLQDHAVKDWIDNSMLFLEVDDLDAFQTALHAKNLKLRYPAIRISAIKEEAWARTLFVHDPSGILWHIAEFV
ncbi:MAG: glyoxalase [Bacteroidia bacterium]